MKYRKISPCIWNDAKVRELSDKGKLALLFLLTHPHMTPLGAIRANAPGLACELGWSEKVFRKAFGEVLALGIAKEDPARMVPELPPPQHAGIAQCCAFVGGGLQGLAGIPAEGGHAGAHG